MPASLKRVKPLTSLFVLGLKREVCSSSGLRLERCLLHTIRVPRAGYYFLAELLKCKIIIKCIIFPITFSRKFCCAKEYWTYQVRYIQAKILIFLTNFYNFPNFCNVFGMIQFIAYM